MADIFFSRLSLLSTNIYTVVCMMYRTWSRLMRLRIRNYSLLLAVQIETSTLCDLHSMLIWVTVLRAQISPFAYEELSLRH